jgi:hypothetical protein
MVRGRNIVYGIVNGALMSYQEPKKNFVPCCGPRPSLEPRFSQKGYRLSRIDVLILRSVNSLFFSMIEGICWNLVHCTN